MVLAPASSRYEGRVIRACILVAMVSLLALYGAAALLSDSDGSASGSSDDTLALFLQSDLVGLIGGLLLMGAIGVVAALVLARVDALRRLLIPRDRMSAHVDQAAAATFTEEKITLTKDRNAVLLYISVFEGEVRLMPDIGVEQRVQASALGEIQAELANAAGDATAQIVEALERLGKCCAGAFPIQADDENELPDRPQIRMP